MDFSDKSILVKKPHQDKPLTPDEAKEFFACANDYFYFAENYVYIQTEMGQELYKLRDYQEEMTDIILDNRFTIFNSPRQTGKTITVGSLLLWHANFFPDTKIGVTSRKRDDAKDIIQRIQYAYEGLPEFLKTPVKEYQKLTLGFTNGSKIEAEATTENTFRGRTYSIIYLDELAFVKENIAEAFWSSLVPSISAGTQTKVIITSTPNGTDGLYANLWFNAETKVNDFVSYKVDHNRVQGRDEKFKQSMIAKIGLTKYLQEFEGAFLSSKPTLISSMILDNLKPKDPIKEVEEMKFFENPNGRMVGISVDVGTGIGADYHVIQVFDVETLEQIAEWRDNLMSQTDLTKKLIRILKTFKQQFDCPEVYYTIESNSYGYGVINLILNSEDPVLDECTFISSYDSKHPGIQMTGRSKAAGCALFKDLVETKKMTLNSKTLLTELKFFVKKANTFKSESETIHDDVVMSCIIFSLMLKELTNYEDSVYEKINTIGGNVGNGIDEDGTSEYDQPMPVEF